MKRFGSAELKETAALVYRLHLSRLHRFLPPDTRELVECDAAPARIAWRLIVFDTHAHHDAIVALECSDLAERNVLREADEV
jgi:hypothetical protein